MRPKNADSEATHTKIVEAAESLLAEASKGAGVEGLSMRAVARAAGVSLGTLSYYFENKDALLEACLDSYYARMQACIAELVARAPGREQDEILRDAARALYRFHLRERAMLELRVLTRVRLGRLPDERQRLVLGPMVGEGAKVVAALCGIDERAARFGIQSMTYLITHFTLCSDEELRVILGDDATREHVEEHLGEVAVRLFGPRTVSDSSPG